MLHGAAVSAGSSSLRTASRWSSTCRPSNYPRLIGDRRENRDEEQQIKRSAFVYFKGGSIKILARKRSCIIGANEIFPVERIKAAHQRDFSERTPRPLQVLLLVATFVRKDLIASTLMCFDVVFSDPFVSFYDVPSRCHR